MRNEDVVRCRHILDAAREAVEYAQGATRADLDTVWRTATQDLPPLIARLEAFLPSDNS